jgi:hypothetical protein
LKGRKIDRIAVVSTNTGDWYTQDLREPADGFVIPILTIREFRQVGLESGGGPSPAFVYGAGRYGYGFSFEAKRWDVAELPEGSSAEPYQWGNPLVVEGGGHIFTFNSKIGKWDHLDLNALINTPDSKDEGQAEPKK